MLKPKCFALVTLCLMAAQQLDGALSWLAHGPWMVMVMAALGTAPPIAIGMQDNYGVPAQVLMDVLLPVGVCKGPSPVDLMTQLLVTQHAQCLRRRRSCCVSRGYGLIHRMSYAR